MSDTDQTFVPLPKLPADGLRITPLGGLGEIGRNMTVLEHQSRLMVMDCGEPRTSEHQPGVNLFLPDFATLYEGLGKNEVIVLTRGYDDPIGPVHYLLRERQDIPVVGSELTIALVTY